MPTYGIIVILIMATLLIVFGTILIFLLKDSNPYSPSDYEPTRPRTKRSCFSWGMPSPPTPSNPRKERE